MIQAIRDVEFALGDGIKGPRPSEINNKTIARKSIVAARDIAIGAVFCELDLSVKRPGLGDSPFTYWSLQSKTASRSYKEGDLIHE